MANWSTELPDTASEGDAGHVEDHNAIVGAVTELRGVVDDVETAAAADPSWGDVTGKPSTFPAKDHTHGWADVTGKPSVFPAEDHTHAVGDVTGLEDRFTAVEQRLDALEAAGGEPA